MSEKRTATMSDYAAARNEARLRTAQGDPSYVYTDRNGMPRVTRLDTPFPEDAQGADPRTFIEACNAKERMAS